MLRSTQEEACEKDPLERTFHLGHPEEIPQGGAGGTNVWTSPGLLPSFLTCWTQLEARKPRSPLMGSKQVHLPGQVAVWGRVTVSLEGQKEDLGPALASY